jgi:hypothetical protein
VNGHRITDATQALQYMLAGKATVSLKSAKSGDHLTYRVTKPKPSLSKPNGPSHFVKVRTGNDFAYLGFIGKDGAFVHGKKADLPADSLQAKAFRWAVDQLRAKQLPDKLEVWHEGRCGRCNRPLTDPASIASGIGPDCASKMECY